MAYADDPDALNVPWVDSPFFEKLAAAQEISPEFRKTVEAYARDGYVVIDPEIPDADAVSKKIIRALEGRYHGQRRIQDAWQFNENVRQLAVLPKVLSFLKQLYRREPVPFQTLNFPLGTQSSKPTAIRFISRPCPKGLCAEFGLRWKMRMKRAARWCFIRAVISCLRTLTLDIVSQ